MLLCDREMEALGRLSQGLDLMRTETKRDISLQALQAFLIVAEKEGQSLVEICRSMGARPSTVSRQLLDLGTFDRLGRPGYGLVERGKSPLDPCAASYTLTPKGHLLVDRLNTIMQDNFGERG